MAAIGFVEHQVTARVPELGNASNTVESQLTVRVDPLTGHTSRILHGERLAPTVRPDLSALTAPPPFCPFCEDKIELATGTFDASITSEGRIRRGVSAVVPNVMAYSEFSSVGLYDTTRHFVDLDGLSPSLVGDLLTGLVAYSRGVGGLRPMWHSINANYLPPAGSSLVHPHAQSAHDDFGTTAQRRLIEASQAWEAEHGTSFWATLVGQENGGPRWLGTRGRVSVLTPWAPVGFHEVWAVLPEVHDIVELTDADCADLGAILSGIMSGYHAANLASFNWALYGGGAEPTTAYGLLLRVVSRSNPDPVYRSDATYFERLHSEAMIDSSPEQVCEKLTPHLSPLLDG
ncbi:MAG: hypothetical protein Q4G51_04415 [Dermatophilus congolensis]|nr:hypothetical protein [Dermatophilus congolensis]